MDIIRNLGLTLLVAGGSFGLGSFASLYHKQYSVMTKLKQDEEILLAVLKESEKNNSFLKKIS